MLNKLGKKRKGSCQSRAPKLFLALQAMMDRERKDELPQMQVEFIDVVCRPLYCSLSESFPWVKPLLDGCLSNREKWADLAEKVSIKNPAYFLIVMITIDLTGRVAF